MWTYSSGWQPLSWRKRQNHDINIRAMKKEEHTQLIYIYRLKSVIKSFLRLWDVHRSTIHRLRTPQITCIYKLIMEKTGMRSAAFLSLNTSWTGTMSYDVWNAKVFQLQCILTVFLFVMHGYERLQLRELKRAQNQCTQPNWNSHCKAMLNHFLK